MIVFVDEVGCASIASGLMVSAVALPTADSRLDIKNVKDSKELTRQQREVLFPQIASQVSYSFGSSCPAKIERLNLHYAKLDAMRISVEKLARGGIKIDEVIVDGKFTIPNLNYPQKAIIKADMKFYGCSCASILAKCKRDWYMAELSKIEKYSYYGWEQNSGYYTESHREGIILHGPTDLHRKTFDFFKYCLFCHEKYKELNKTYEEYLEYEKEEEKKSGMSFYKLWKSNSKNVWKEIKYGESR